LDEFLSLSVAEHLLTLLSSIRGKPELAAALSAEDARLAGLIKSEDAARAAAGYPSVVDKATGSEAMFYRRAVLANFFSSVLELENKTSNWAGVFQVLFSLSAGISALTALIVMQVVRGHLAAHWLALILVGMGLEILKDRLKEAIKLWTTRRWTRRFSDAVTAIRDPSSGKVVGKVRESFGFVPRFDLPPEVLKIRQADPLAAVGEDGKPEDVLYYQREVTIDPRTIEKYHTRRRNLDDLMLVNLLPFLDNTDDKEVEFSTLDPESGRLETLTGTRVHHVNIVTRYDVRRPEKASATRYERRRVVMDREGIKRVESVPLPAAASVQPSLPASYLPLPIVKQETDYSCGVAALLSALRYWQAYEGDEESLYELLETTPENGTEPIKLAEGARKFGLRAEMKTRATLQDLEAALARGEAVILDIQAWADHKVPDWRKEWGSGHYVVLIGMDRQNAYVMDPSAKDGYGWLPLSELMDRWHDVEERHGRREVNEQLAIFLSGKNPLKKEAPAPPLERVEYR
jgi:predicted double-glycine peptidase